MRKKRSTFKGKSAVELNARWRSRYSRRYPRYGNSPSPHMLAKLARRSAAWTGARADG